jgi:hypothetical protein
MGLQILEEAGEPQERIHAKAILPIRKKGNLLLCTLLLGNTMVNGKGHTYARVWTATCVSHTSSMYYTCWCVCFCASVCESRVSRLSSLQKCVHACRPSPLFAFEVCTCASSLFATEVCTCVSSLFAIEVCTCVSSLFATEVCKCVSFLVSLCH